MKKQLLTIIAFALISLSAKTQNNPINNEETVGDNLSFLKGQKELKFEFSYEGLTIGGEPEADFLKKSVEKMNKDTPGDGDTMLKNWESYKATKMPDDFINAFSSPYVNGPLKGVTNSNKPKYVCVVKLISVKTGTRNLVTPTCWISYYFYEIKNRDKLLAFCKSHIAYAKDKQSRDTFVSYGSWVEMDEAYDKAGIELGKRIKKALK